MGVAADEIIKEECEDRAVCDRDACRTSPHNGMVDEGSTTNDLADNEVNNDIFLTSPFGDELDCNAVLVLPFLAII